MAAISHKGPDYQPLLRHFSLTDGLIRGTGLVNYVVVTAAFALLPGFGIHGLLISNAIQDITTGVLEIPFGWVADRFGWAKAFIISTTLKCVVPLILIAAVFAAWTGSGEWCWLFIAMEAVVDAFVTSLQNGAFEAAYSEWYRIEIRRRFGEPIETPPPLFIRSLQYSMWIRLLIPISIVALIMALQLFPLGLGNFSAYTATFIALGFIFALRFIVLLRVFYDLRGVRLGELERIARQREAHGFHILKSTLSSIRGNFPAFSLYSIACFQYTLSCMYIAGIAMQQMNKMSFPQPYSWLASVGLTLFVYILDSFFWVSFGYKISKENAVSWIRNLAVFLLVASLGTTTLYTFEAHPLIQAVGFATCVFAGTICAGAIKRYFASHCREWLKSDLIATWMSFSESISILVLGGLSIAVVQLDAYLPNAVALLIVSIIVTLATVYYLSSGALDVQYQTVPLRILLGKSALGIAILAGALIGAVSVYFSVVDLVNREVQAEERYLAGLRQTTERRYAEKASVDASLALPAAEWGGLGHVACVWSSDEHWVGAGPVCSQRQFSLAVKDYVIDAVRGDGVPVSIKVRFDRAGLFTAAIRPFVFAAALFLFGVAMFYRLLVGFTKRVHRELDAVLQAASQTQESRETGENRFTITEFKSLTEQLMNVNRLRGELTRHKTIAEVSARVAHDIRSPLAAFEAIAPDLKELPESVRVVLRSATQRIHEIARDLLQAERTAREEVVPLGLPDTSKKPVLCLVPTILREVVSEKRLCFNKRPNIALDLEIEASAFGAFAPAEGTLLKCVISNLIQNSAEAIGEQGKIEVKAVSTFAATEVTITDDGHGIPSEVLRRLTDERTSYGKRNGHGLGLYNARKSIEVWGGSFKIESHIGEGTRVTISLPRCEPPAWFVSCLEVHEGDTLCVLDDDPSIHALWDRRFRSAFQGSTKTQVVHFSSSHELKEWLGEQPSGILPLFLIDQELANEDTNGLGIFEELPPAGRYYLVTSYFENERILERCSGLGVKLIPKPMVGDLPVQFVPSLKRSTKIRLVSIDSCQ